MFHLYRTIDADDAEIFSDPLPTVLASHHSVLFYAESVGVVTSGQVTKIAIIPFDPQWPKIPCYTQTSRHCLF